MYASIWFSFLCFCIYVCVCVCVLYLCVCVRVCLLLLAGMSVDVLSNPAVGLLWISSELQGMRIPFQFTALPGRKKAIDAFSQLPSHQLEPAGVCVCVCVRAHVCVCVCENGD